MTKQTTQEDTRPLDPNVRQWAASHPLENVWVSASAGTGKTKVLTDRVLRLLLPRMDGQAGTPPHRILCLTYTKAAASEMLLRINKVLGQWAVLGEEALEESLRKTMGHAPSAEMRLAARRLFAQVVDTPGGLKIMTIHAFCQSVLGRFPLEAGISPQMRVIEEGQAREMIYQAVLARAESAAFNQLSVELSQADLMKNLQICLSEADQLENFVRTYPGEEAQKAALRKAYEAPDAREADLIETFCQRQNVAMLKRFADALSKGAKKDQGRAVQLYDWLALGDVEPQAARFEMFRDIFLTQKGEPRKSVSAGAKETMPEAPEVQQEIADTLLQLDDQIRAVRQVALTDSLLTLAKDVQDAYRQEKQRAGILDYNDLLLKTLQLLKRAKRSVSWVLYKLDGGLDHILLDEAQDTNPIQWEMMALLVEEFFQEEQHVQTKAQTSVRTLFVVGDEKQSIYRFQGASLEDFQYMRDSLGDRATAARAKWRNEALQMSFRSTRSVLGFVDAAFQEGRMRADIGVPADEELAHFSWRSRQAGRVELWPLIPQQEPVPRIPWQVPIQIQETVSPKALLAEQVATQIAGWLATKRILPSKNRPVRPGDILVLVRSRNAFVDLLIRALKTRQIPVSGADRLVLDQSIAVQDLLSLAKFALQPRDDLSLAEILTSPFIGVGEEDLEEWAHGRSGSLWQQVEEKAPADVVHWLRMILNKASAAPFAFFLGVLNKPCPADAVSGLRALEKRLGHESLDVLDEFLRSVQSYELEHPARLQSFLVWQQANPIEIKRQQDGQEDAVRIMTVHGAKGLQAPIVFLPDLQRSKTAVQTKIPRLLFPRRSGAAVPMWSPRKASDSKAYTRYLDKIAAQETAEYKRLFYVAATRAEDELILMDAEAKTAADEESWYEYARRAFDNLGDDVEMDGDVKVYAHPQIGAEEEEEHSDGEGEIIHTSPLPAWALCPAPEEPAPPRPLRPSRAAEEEEDAPLISPRTEKAGEYRFRRGLLTHTLLQFLPDLEGDQRVAAGQTFLDVQAADLSAEIRRSILDETLALMEDSRFSEIFSPAAQAEVSLSGMLASGRLISGQIDRMIVTEDEVLIIDYKTNRPPPENAADVPIIYQNQMRAYKEALARIYPDKQVRCALLWTYGPRLMAINV